ncbi:MAG: sulfatase [Bacteroidota bacterium]
MTKSIFFLLFILIQSIGFSQSLNVVYINIDDLGYRDLGFMGSTYYETPNIDQLAREGMIFTQAYAGAANCAPSRACLMSGMNTPRHGIYTVGNSDRGDARTRKIVPVSNETVLADTIYTLAEMFRDEGYTTGTFGKWHLGDDPTTQGFDVNVAGSHRGNPGKDGYFSPYNVDYLTDGPAEEYLTDRLTDEAIQFLEENQEKPFFLYLPYYTVHTPIIGKPELIKRFETKVTVNGQDNPVYAAMIASLDENVGRLLEALDQLNLKNKTIVVLTSDNGGIRDISYQDPLRAGKGSYYEGGIRVPLIIRWPEQVAPQTTCITPVSNLDFYPTFQDILNIQTTEQQPQDGISILPLLKGKDIAERPLFWHFPIYLQAYNPKEDAGRDPLFRTRPGSVVRLGEWKLHHYYEDDSLELYNLAKDFGETTNVAGDYPEVKEKLYQLLSEWLRSHRADLSFLQNSEYDPEYENHKTTEVLQ